jgi:hypothetical protein
MREGTLEFWTSNTLDHSLFVGTLDFYAAADP